MYDLPFFLNLFKSDLPFIQEDKIYSFQDTLFKIKTRAKSFNGIKKNEVVEVICFPRFSTIIEIFTLWYIGAIPLLISHKDPQEEIERKKFSLSTFKVSDDNLKIIFFTSGSQGDPKAVLHTLDNLILSAQASNTFYKIERTDRYLVTLPLNHVGGLMIFIRSLISKCLCIFPNGQTSYGNYYPTLLSLVPTQLLKLKDEFFLKNTKAILIGGNAIFDSLKPLIKELPISLTYGMTESAAQVAASRPFTENMEILPGREIKITPEGLVSIKGGMGKYINGPDHPDFFPTSDKGTFENGFLKIEGRVDQVFIRGGENISPLEIENAALEINEIINAKVIPVPDSIYGNIPILFYQSQREISENEILMNLSKKLPPYKIPGRIFRIDVDFKPSNKELLNIYESSLS